VILVDSSVWIDYFRGTSTPESDYLDQVLGREPIGVGDLILTEVLQGFAAESDFRQAQRLLDSFALVEIGGRDVAIAAARNFRSLRSVGVTVRKTIDTLIASRCILDGHALLFSDRDFEPFVKNLGLVSAFSA
jgi:predicted nucleic acid-binding protein